jgi:hypothetical protein
MAAADDHLDGCLDMRLDKVLTMEIDQKYTSNGTISRFNWYIFIKFEIKFSFLGY